MDDSASPRAGNAGGASHTRNTSGSHQHQDGQGRGSNRGSRYPRGGRGRGRGYGRGAPTSNAHVNDPVSPQDSSGRPPGGFGGRLTEAATNIQDDLNIKDEDAPVADEAVAEDAEVCFICASPIEHLAIAPCNHQTCHICSLRLRALYKTRACAHCRTESPFVIFTDNPDKHFQDFEDSEFVKIDENLGVKYEKDIILEDTILLLRYNCPDKDCEVACLGWPDLHRHVKTKHAKVMCDLCTRNKKVFTHEHELFSFGELRRHEKYGDDNPGAIDQSGFKGHPECGFCKQRFYGDDELYTHCREKHERCHICDRRNGGRNPQYYLNYQELEKHFADAHFVCVDAECVANKTNVFESELDLKAHQLSEHPNGLSKDARRDARLISLSGFDLRTPYQPSRRGGRDRDREPRGGNGRGRDPNAEPLPSSSAHPMSRAELAYQRQMAIQNASSGPGRTFGGSLTQSAPRPASSHQQQSRLQQQSTTVADSTINLENLSLDSSAAQAQSTANLTPQEQARALRHTSVTNRATTLLQNNATKLSQFRTHVSAYRSGTTTAPDLIDSFFSLFDCPSSELGKLIRELADLYEDESKRQALLEAWNNWRSINEDYPSLPGPQGGAIPGSGVGGLMNSVGTGRRVLKLKNSTAQSSRSAVSRQGSWGNAPLDSASNAGGNSTAAARDPFPALSSAVNKSKTGQSTGWGSGAQTTASRLAAINNTGGASRGSRPSSGTSTPRAGNPSTMSQRQNEDMFPSLPAAAKPNVMMAGFNTRGAGKWSGTSTPTGNAWGSPRVGTPAQTAALDSAISDAVEESNGAGKKKGRKGKGKGELLYHFG